MKSIHTLAVLLLSGLAMLTLGSCRMGVYTAPLVPRFSVTASDAVLTGFTNANDNRMVLTGSVKLTDLTGDTGYSAAIRSIQIYQLSSNAGSLWSLLGNIAQTDPKFQAITNVSKANSKVGNEITLGFTWEMAGGAAGVASYTNNAAIPGRKVRYGLSVTTEDGASAPWSIDGVAQSAVVSNVSTLEAGWSAVLQ
jgi:hypothetical protein